MNKLEELVETAIQAAFAAGLEILDVYGSAFAVEHKDDRSPLTEADKRAHRAIVAVLADTGLPVLSEEGREIAPEERQQWQRYWLVDPLDGTKEFVKRNGEFTVNIALMERDGGEAGPNGAAVPVGGVLYVPVKDVLYFAWQGGGAYRLAAAATLAQAPAYERAARATRLPMRHERQTYTIVASRSHQSPETEAFIRRAEEEHGKVQLTSMGSALKICLVAEGDADVYPRYAPTMEWDTAAGHAVLRAAGGEVCTLDGAPLRYGKPGFENPHFVARGAA
jgi:3'(2'), 5'-bisphosphate nucleotidase